MDDHILQSWMLKNDGKWVDLGKKDPQTSDEYTLHWLHLCRDSLATQKRLFSEGIDEIIIDKLTTEDTRPRTSIYPDGVLVNLRAVNISEDKEPHEMLSMRIFIEKNRIVSTSLEEIHLIADIKEILTSGYQPASKSEFLTAIIELITDRMELYVSDEKDKVYEMECELIGEYSQERANSISDVRRSVITFARYLSPQKDAILRLITLKEQIFTDDEKIVLTECVNNTSRFLEDLESVNNRCHVLKDDLHSLSAEKMNRNMYLLSIITLVFLPLTFLTGLFGVNLGGIPGAERSDAFYIFSIVLVAVFILQVIIFRISNRF
jgi:zinc transporter